MFSIYGTKTFLVNYGKSKNFRGSPDTEACRLVGYALVLTSKKVIISIDGCTHLDPGRQWDNKNFLQNCFWVVFFSSIIF